MLGEMLLKEVDRGQKGARSALGGGVGCVCVCGGGNWLVAMPLGTSMLNRGLTDKTLEPVPPHSSVPLKHHLLSLGQFSHLYIEIRAPMHDKIVALCRRRWVFGM